MRRSRTGRCSRVIIVPADRGEMASLFSFQWLKDLNEKGRLRRSGYPALQVMLGDDVRSLSYSTA